MGPIVLLLAGCVAPPTPARPVPVDRTPPAIAISPASPVVAQGGTLAVFVRTDESAVVEVSVLGRTRPTFPVAGDVSRALIGVPIRAEPGPTPLVITATDPWANRAEVTVDVLVAAVDWPETGKLPMSKAKAKTEPEAMQRMREARDAVYRTATDRQRWTGPMRVPVEEGTHTSVFGAFREYPDGARNHHDAEDIARKRGTPVVAAADGVVALAELQEVHGNAVLIDHGQKVVSLYSHLDTLGVAPGQAVAAGDRLGTMGSTGRTTGPHLHWGVVVDEVPVDPMAWTRDAFGLPGPDAFRVVEAATVGGP